MKTANQLNSLAKRIHKLNHKWWHTPDGKRLDRNRGELLMLVITELSEAVDGIRKDLMDDKLPHRKMEEVEMADAVIRLLDYAGGFGLKLSETYGLRPNIERKSNKSEQILKIVMRVGSVNNPIVVDPSYWITISIRAVEEYCRVYRLDLWGAVEEKLKFNRTRKDHTHEARAAKNGKKF